MPSSSSRLARNFRIAAMAVSLAVTGISTGAPAQKAAVTAMPGQPSFLMGSFDLSKLGYREDEYFLSGTASSYRFITPPTSDGHWNAAVADSAPYKTRIVVLRPSDPARFNGTVLVEWLNVTGGQDTPADWMVGHREMIRKGFAYVGVTAQHVGVEGGNGPAGGLGGVPLKKTDPARYGSLVHPGDAFSYDMYSQAGAVLKSPRAGGVLGPLVPRHVIAMGESQSAAYLVTYVNAVDPLARVYDGFLVHSRFGSGSSLAGIPMGGGASKMPEFAQYRRDLRVPVLTLITETDLLGSGLSGYYSARRPDDSRLRVWEVAGTAHADNYLFGGAFIDSGLEDVARLAAVFVPSTTTPMGKAAEPINPGMPHHYVLEAAIAAIDNWVRTGRPPASTSVMEAAAPAAPGAGPSLVLDANGLVKGGVRTPWVDVPTIRLSGKGDPASFLGRLTGKGVPFDKAILDSLYPGGKADYLRKFTAALDSAIRAGHIAPEDRQEILAIAAINYERP